MCRLVKSVILENTSSARGLGAATEARSESALGHTKGPIGSERQKLWWSCRHLLCQGLGSPSSVEADCHNWTKHLVNGLAHVPAVSEHSCHETASVKAVMEGRIESPTIALSNNNFEINQKM